MLLPPSFPQLEPCTALVSHVFCSEFFCQNPFLTSEAGDLDRHHNDPYDESRPALEGQDDEKECKCPEDIDWVPDLRIQASRYKMARLGRH